MVITENQECFMVFVETIPQLVDSISIPTSLSLTLSNNLNNRKQKHIFHTIDQGNTPFKIKEEAKVSSFLLKLISQLCLPKIRGDAGVSFKDRLAEGC